MIVDRSLQCLKGIDTRKSSLENFLIKFIDHVQESFVNICIELTISFSFSRKYL
jgi:hypothetical protein